MTDEDQKQRKRVAVFHGADAEPLGEDRMPTEGLAEAVLAGLAKFAAANVETGAGERASVLFSEPGEEGLSLVHVWFKSGYMLPAHAHSTDCLYYVLGGELRLGRHVLRKGDGFFIPAGKAYAYEAGPDGVEVLEFRNATRFNIVLKETDEGRWDRMVAHYKERAAIWARETVPPSDR